jgi:hypothetical protein
MVMNENKLHVLVLSMNPNALILVSPKEYGLGLIKRKKSMYIVIKI